MSEQLTPEELAAIRRDWNPIYTEGMVIHSLVAEIERLRSGEFICKECGLRKDADASGVSNEF